MPNKSDHKSGQTDVVAGGNAKNKLHVELDFGSCTQAGGLVHCFSVTPVGKVGIHFTQEQFDSLKKKFGS